MKSGSQWMNRQFEDDEVITRRIEVGSEGKQEVRSLYSCEETVFVFDFMPLGPDLNLSKHYRVAA